jgi:RNA polymerase sigma-70 factor, ECF subfamily
MSEPGEVTTLLKAWASGDEGALNELIPLVHQELHHLAFRQVAGERGPNPTLQPTALVNEAYLRLVKMTLRPRDRLHFFRLTARIMEHVLIDYARQKISEKRGRGGLMIPMDEIQEQAKWALSPEDALALSQCLSRLRQLDSDLCDMFELKFLCGWSQADIAIHLMTSEATVSRDLQAARAWLQRELEKVYRR